jgi:hypothetical protein
MRVPTGWNGVETIKMAKPKTRYIATVLKVDGSIMTQELDKSPDLQKLQEFVGGYIERVPLWTTYMGRRCNVYADEEGKLYNKPLNVRATQMWQKAIAPRQAYPLVGDIVIVTTQPKEK